MQGYKIFHVMKPGVLTTFQDMGRYGYQQYGIPVSGAMDTYALQVANILVGNNRNEAALEVTLIGPTLQATAPVTVAITGADLSPSLNGKSIPTWKSIDMDSGDKLVFGNRKSGMRAYIAVAGGLDVPSLFGSKSRDRLSNLGVELEKDQAIYGFEKNVKSGITLDNVLIPNYNNEANIAMVEGPHSSCFSDAAKNTFFNSTYKVESNSNRMGYRLSGEIAIKADQDKIWSDAVPFGGIQVPGNGQPIILMADRQTTGGYPRIGTVISTDLPKIAQLVPNNLVNFYSISVQEAQSNAKKIEETLLKLETFYRNISYER